MITSFVCLQVCLQEVQDPKALAKICTELNEPTLRRVCEWRENARSWKYVVSSQCLEGHINGLGFLFDNSQCKFVAKMSQEIDLVHDDDVEVSGRLGGSIYSDRESIII